jgi:hypothetical protein
MNQFELCMKNARERERTHWERTRERVYGHFTRKIEQNGGSLPAICYQIKAMDHRGNAFRSTEVIDLDERCNPGWWDRLGYGAIGNPAVRREYGSKWVIEESADDTAEEKIS